MFMFSILGEPPKEVADKFWSDIEQYKVNFTVLDGKCFVYGNANEEVENILFEKVLELGFVFSYDKGVAR